MVNNDKVLLSSIHIKLDLMKSFGKMLNNDSQVFLYFAKEFPKVSDAKLSAGNFGGPQIKMFLKDQDLTKIISVAERNVWESFRLFSLLNISQIVL